MTGARRQQKPWGHCLIAGAVAATLTTYGGREAADAATTGRVVVDALSGLALSGFDPVAYFTDGAPQLGEGTHEITYRGAVWRFRNEGNRAAFAHHPDVYAPRFGGYDPVALMRGVALAGHPLIWLVADNRLYLFSRVEMQRKFSN